MFLRVRAIDSRYRRDVERFIQFTFDLYRENPKWVPPLVSDMRFLLNRRKHPFYIHSDAVFFVAEEGDRVLGRLAVLDNRRYNDFQGSSTAFFNLFESIDDEAVAKGLFEAGEAWARDKGLNLMIGPLGFVRGDSMGLLVEGFEHRPAVGIAYHLPYYDTLMKKAGYAKRTDYFSGYLQGGYKLSERFTEIAERVKMSRGFWIKSFRTKAELRRWIPKIQHVVNESFAGNHGHFPLGKEELKLMADRLLAIARPRLIKLVMKGEEIIGFLFAFVDISAALQKTKGRLWPLGWLTVLQEFGRADWVNINGVGLLPDRRGVGANAVLYTELERTIHAFGFKHADVVQIEEKNIKSMGDMKAIGVEWYKTHRVYEKKI